MIDDLKRVQELLAALEGVAGRLDAAAGDPAVATSLLGEAGALAEELAAEVDRTRAAVRDARDAERDD